jgi:hypothetical protein
MLIPQKLPYLLSKTGIQSKKKKAGPRKTVFHLRIISTIFFDILLFGVSLDHGPAKVYDLANGETVPV